jgi:aryl-alcohol dehydrogenase-like predicted oxidoreductase
MPNHTTMPVRTLGRTGLEVSAFALGTVELGLEYGISAPGQHGRPSQDEAIRLVHSALDAGINLIDTARAYGTSEEVLGHALKDRRDRVIIASKTGTQAPGGVPLTGDDLRRHMLASLQESLTALQTDYLDIWQIHNVDRSVLNQAEIVAEVFADVRAKGLVRYTGGSFYGADFPLEALALNLFDVMQITYSILDQRLSDRFFPLATEANIGILARSVLLKGALTERAEHLPAHLNELRLRARSLRELIAANQISATSAQTAIAFALAQPAIHSVLIGVSSEFELRSNLHGLSLELSPTFLEQLKMLRIDDADLLNPGTWGIP